MEQRLTRRLSCHRVIGNGKGVGSESWSVSQHRKTGGLIKGSQTAALRYKTGTAPIEKISPALMIKGEDLDDLHEEWLRVPEWVRAHASITQPAHRYEGALTIEDHCLVFQGRDRKERTGFKEMISLDSITKISLGLRSSRLLKLKPLIINYHTDDGGQIAYMFIDFDRQSGIANGNQDWFEVLRPHVDRNRLGPRNHSSVLSRSPYAMPRDYSVKSAQGSRG
jgi:hypothetical protein